MTTSKYATAEPSDCAAPLPSTCDLRNATPVDPDAIAAFAELVALMRVTGNLLDADLLHALIARLADLLGETVPPDL